MTVRPILTTAGIAPRNGKSVLLQATQPLRRDLDKERLGLLLRDLVDTLLAHPIAIGLSANQVGIPLSVAVVSLSRDTSSDLTVLINPEVLGTSGGRDRKYESCMSVPGVRGTVERRQKARVQHLNEELDLVTTDLSGFTARAWMHEIDHLHGVLFKEHLVGHLEKTPAFDYPQPESIPYSTMELQVLTEALGSG